MKRLICFAVADEKRFFQPSEEDTILVTGMGPLAAEQAMHQALSDCQPDLIIAAGFAGGLNPELISGQVVIDDRRTPSGEENPHGCQTGTFFKGRIHSSPSVLITPEEKAAFRSETKADAVDMESDTIRRIADEHGIPMIALRSVSDTAQESLPLDFNRFMSPNGGMHYGRLITHLMLHPGSIPSLIRFQKQVQFAARQLGESLGELAI